MYRVFAICGLVAAALYGFQMNPDLEWGTKIAVWSICGFIAYYLRGSLKKDMKENPKEFGWLTWNRANFLIDAGLIAIVILTPLVMWCVSEIQRDAGAFWFYSFLPLASPFIFVFAFLGIGILIEQIKSKKGIKNGQEN